MPGYTDHCVADALQRGDGEVIDERLAEAQAAITRLVKS
jgi:hypothetical protein